jgi:stearoyl-CoA desaturase (delta-9 desaturase)
VQILIAVAVALALTEVAVLATSIYLHRGLAHRSLEIEPAASVLFRVILWLTTGQSRQEWVAVHRKHHAFTDREGDPHSPRLLGFWRVQLLNVYHYIVAARDRSSIATYAPDIAPDRLDRVLFSRGVLGLAIGLGVLCVLLGPRVGLLAGGLHAVLYVVVLAPLINAVGHWRGRRTYDNTARNSTVLAWVTAGESLHNNHHAHPRSAKFSVRRWEFDPSWPIIRSLAAAGLLVIVGPPIAWSRAIAQRSAP